MKKKALKQRITSLEKRIEWDHVHRTCALQASPGARLYCNTHGEVSPW